MKRFTLISLVPLFIIAICGQRPDHLNSVSDKMFSPDPSSVKIEGYLGDKINLVISRRIKTQDVDHLVDPFRHRNETSLWQGEFWGKWILSAIAAYEYTKDPELLKMIRVAESGILSTQTQDGYIGNYKPSAQLQQWDVWGRKYTLLGLLSCFELTGDKTAIKGAKKLADHLLTQLGPGKADIVTTGNYRGMPSSSILEPIVQLYRLTGEQKYLDFALYIVKQWETENGPELISKALEGIPVAERFPHPESWWSWENGQKAYEMMSCYEGLLDLYRITGTPVYLKAVEMAVVDIIESEINIAGSGSAFECFYKGNERQTDPTYHTMETCVTMTWMKLCFNLLRLTENPKYADQIEISTYNALMASLKADASQIAKYCPLEGIRHAGEEQCGMHINCCSANGPRAFMMLPRFAVMHNEKEIFINMYGNITSSIEINTESTVTIRQNTDYPFSGKIEVEVSPGKQDSFTVAIRIPLWSKINSVTVNEATIGSIESGKYLRISRVWNKGDRIIINLDLTAKLITLNGYQAILRGPVVLSRDARFNDGIIYEPTVIQSEKGNVELVPSQSKPDDVWMAFAVKMVTGTDLEGEDGKPRNVVFCDFASAGNTWDEDSRYKVWLKKTVNVMEE